MPKMKVIPKSEMTEAEIFTLEQKIERGLINMALEKDLAESEADLVVRDLIPNIDLAMATNNWVNQVATVANAWQAAPDINARLAGAQQNRCIAFYKIINRTLAPNITMARFGLGTTGVLGVLQLEELYAEQENVGFFGPIFYNDGETVRIDYYADAVVAIGGEQIGLPAMVCEPYGEQIAMDAKKRVTAAKWL